MYSNISGINLTSYHILILYSMNLMLYPSVLASNLNRMMFNS